MGNTELESATSWLSWLHGIQIAATLMVALGVALEFMVSWFERPLQRKIDDARMAEIARLNNETEVLRSESAKANERAALTEQTLLAERRLTAKERWRLARVEKAVFPRAVTKEQFDFLVPALRGKIKAMTICAVDRAEPRIYALTMLQVLQTAGVSTKLSMLHRDDDVQGVSTYAVNEDGRFFADTLWKVGIGGSTLGILPIGLKGQISPSENCLIIGENNAAFQPADGQPGEDLDEHGNPVPRP